MDILASGGCTLQVRDCGDSAVRVAVDAPSADAAWRVAHGLAALLRAQAPVGLLGTLPTYDAVLVEFDCTRTDHAVLRAAIAGLVDALDNLTDRTPRTFTVPVVYGGEHGPDLGAVAELLDLSPSDVIARHTAEPLLIRCFGSPAGAPMMDGPAFGRPIPRLASPRARVAAGAVAVAGRQAVVSACPAPGGWQVLGTTPLSMVDPARKPLAPYLPGDSLQFVPITADEFDAHRGVLA